VSGACKSGDKVIGQGGIIGAGLAFGEPSDTGAVAAEDSRVFALTKAQLDAVSELHPRLGLKLYQNLASLHH
jgi:CRP-like cAMP-binding protein